MIRDNSHADVPILYQDDSLVAVAKPSGWLVHRGWARDRVVLMTAVRDAVGQHVYPLHRLDRGTSGVVLFALERDQVAGWQARWPAVEKRYVALVRGIPPESGTVDHPVPKAPKSPDRVDAVTDFKRLAIAGRYALVELRPRTGRLHQIRRHMKHMSWPLIGDVRYGKGEHNRLFRERYGLHRLALHLCDVTYDVPGTETSMEITGKRAVRYIEAPLPDNLLLPLRRLGLQPDIDRVLSGSI